MSFKVSLNEISPNERERREWKSWLKTQLSEKEKL